MRAFTRRFAIARKGASEGRRTVMERKGNEIHLDTNEARAGSTPHVTRWVLHLSTAGVIIAFIVVAWIMIYH